MDNQEKRMATDIFTCGNTRKAGQDTNLTEEMQKFVNYNVGALNTGWEPETDESGNDKYIYVNIETVKSDTLEITALTDKNHIRIEMPNEYAVGFSMDYITGLLSLVGRNEEGEPKVLDTVHIGRTLLDIQEDDEAHTITFNFMGQDDVVINLDDVIQMEEVREEITEEIETASEEIHEQVDITEEDYDDIYAEVFGTNNTGLEV